MTYNIKELIIEENCYNDGRWSGDLVIENYPNLEKIVVKVFIDEFEFVEDL